MIGTESYRGYSLSTRHPRGSNMWCAYQGSDIWFEAGTREELMQQIDEAMAE